jgi:urease accessory protein
MAGTSVRTDSSTAASFARVRASARKGGLVGVALLALSATLSAHHMTGGKLPVTAVQGFLSGLAHPILGLDHLAVLLALGWISASGRRGRWIPLAFLVASLAGTALHLASVDLAASQLLAAVSVVALGAILIARWPASPGAIVAVACVAGLVHGYAYAESIVGAERAPLAAYLAGFTMVQCGLAMGGQAAARWAARGSEPRRAAWARSIGTAMSLGGLILVVLILSGRA